MNNRQNIILVNYLFEFFIQRISISIIHLSSFYIIKIIHVDI